MEHLQALKTELYTSDTSLMSFLLYCIDRELSHSRLGLVRIPALTAIPSITLSARGGYIDPSFPFDIIRDPEIQGKVAGWSLGISSMSKIGLDSSTTSLIRNCFVCAGEVTLRVKPVGMILG